MTANASIPPPSARPTAAANVGSDGGGWWRHVWKIAVGSVLALTVFALLATLSLAQFASADTAHKVLRRAVASMTEIDPFLQDSESELVTLAANPPEEGIVLPDFPIQVTLSPEEAVLPPTELREILLDRSAEKMYEEGVSAFEDEGQAASISVFSPAGAVKYSLDVLEDENYDRLRLAVASLAGFALVVAIALVLLTRGYARLAAVGVAVSFGALPFLILSVTARFALRLASEDEGDYLVVRLLDLGKDMAWLPIRNGIAFSGLGLAFLILGASVAWWTDLRLSARRRAFQ